MDAPTNLEPIWFSPARFWAATRNMNPEQIDDLMAEVTRLAERDDRDALRRFEFIDVESRYRQSA